MGDYKIMKYSSKSIEEPLSIILEGIRDFRRAIKEREKTGEWQDSHIKELEKLDSELSKITPTIAQLIEENW